MEALAPAVVVVSCAFQMFTILSPDPRAKPTLHAETAVVPVFLTVAAMLQPLYQLDEVESASVTLPAELVEPPPPLVELGGGVGLDPGPVGTAPKMEAN